MGSAGVVLEKVDVQGASDDTLLVSLSPSSEGATEKSFTLLGLFASRLSSVLIKTAQMIEVVNIFLEGIVFHAEGGHPPLLLFVLQAFVFFKDGALSSQHRLEQAFT